MPRASAALLLPFVVALAATPACFPDFEVNGDGGPNGSNGDDGGTKHDATTSGDDDDSGTIITLPDGAKVLEDGGPIPTGDDSGGGPAVDGGPGYVPPGTFTFTFGPESETTSTTASFTHGMYMDVTEVTVADFTAWVTNGRHLPNDGQSLDPGGPYANEMYWQAAWNTFADAEDYKPATDTCNSARDIYSLGDTVGALAPTYGSTPTTLPINCVNWYQAVAYCASVGERLATQAEWQYEAVGRTHGYTYPWGDAPAPTDCSHAIGLGDGGLTGNNGCGFPLPVGSAPAGRSLDGVLDLEGSLEEWIWDAFSFSDLTPWPADFAGPPEDAGTTEGRDVRGGSWLSPQPSLQSIEPGNLTESDVYTNLGIRCVKTKL
jgi:formylglycine-generating enzyme required for sulfatase activity